MNNEEYNGFYLNKKNNVYYEDLKFFLDIIINNINVDYLENLKENIQKIIIVKNIFAKFIKHDKKCEITANYFKNFIIINLDDKRTIFHELFHMASDSGFHLKNSKTGIAINEGYTELLTTRYFGNYPNNSSNIYNYLEHIASLTELIVGEEKMKECYFKANLGDLLESLSNYSNKKDTKLFIDNLDEIEETKRKYDNKKLKRKEYEEICKNLNENSKAVSSYLKECYKNKLLKECYSTDEAMEKFEFFIKKLNAIYKENECKRAEYGPLVGGEIEENEIYLFLDQIKENKSLIKEIIMQK